MNTAMLEDEDVRPRREDCSLSIANKGDNKSLVIATFDHAAVCNVRMFISRLQPQVSIKRISGLGQPTQTVYTIRTPVCEFSSESHPSDSCRRANRSRCAPSISLTDESDESGEVMKKRHYCLALRDRRTGDIEVVPVQFVTFRATGVTHPETTNELLLQTANAQNTENESAASKLKRKYTTRQFNDMKQKRLEQQAAYLDLDVTHVEDQINRLSQQHTDDTKDEDGVVKSGIDLIVPPCNGDAASVQDVYKLETILTVPEVQSLIQEVPKVLTDYSTSNTHIEEAVKSRKISPVLQHILTGGYCNYGRDNVATLTDVNELRSLASKQASLIAAESCRVANLDQNQRRVLGLAVGLFAEGLTQLVCRSAGKSSPLPSFVPYKLQCRIQAEFTNRGCWTPALRDKCFAHVMVLLLMASSNFCIEVQPLMTAFRVKLDQIKKLALLIGASVKADTLTERSFIILKLPLVKLERAGARRKGAKRR